MSQEAQNIYVTQYIAGKAVLDEDGELVCLKPFPSMPVYFWNDPQGLKYKKAYFSIYNGKYESLFTVLTFYPILTENFWLLGWRIAHFISMICDQLSLLGSNKTIC